MAKNRHGGAEAPAEQTAAAQGGADEPRLVQEAPPARRFHICLDHSPEAVVTARDGLEAWAKYCKRMSLRGTVNQRRVTEVAEDGEPLSAGEPEAKPAAAPPAPKAAPAVVIE